MANNILTQQYELCCGCKACADVCPQKAIIYKKDREGFFYPEISDACVDCGRCRKVCPEINEWQPASGINRQFIACLDKDRQRRISGSSGGMFGLLAEALMTDGYEICGAAFDERLQLKHMFASDALGVERLKKSKYLQSDCSTLYAQIRSKLKNGKKVMFVGTPCQCNALLNIVNGLQDNLVLVDFACHGVPSQELFDKCIKYYEDKHECKILDFSFRYKPKYYGPPQNFLLTTEKDENVFLKTGGYYEMPFYCGFQKRTTLRPSCYSCHWSNTDRATDITLADYWGIETVTNKWDRTDYPSLVILNSEKGRRIMDSIKLQIEWIETTKADAVRRNESLRHPTVLPTERKLLFDDYQKMPFDDFVNKHLKIKGKWKKDVYYAIPFPIRKVILKMTKQI